MEDQLTIEFERTGGFTGIPLRVILNGGLLEPSEFLSVRQMVENSGFFMISNPELQADTGADQFRYRIAIATAKRRHEVMLTEKQVPENLKPLIRFLTGKVRPKNQ